MLSARSIPVAGVPSGSDDFAELRRREFGRLDRAGHVYLDYTGSALYTESQLLAHQALLLDRVLGNPHSGSPASRASTGMIEEARAGRPLARIVRNLTHNLRSSTL